MVEEEEEGSCLAARRKVVNGVGRIAVSLLLSSKGSRFVGLVRWWC